jgi:hypothetical protein
MLGMLAAIESWVKRDHAAKMKTWYTYLDNISKRVSSISGITTEVRDPKGLSNHSPSLVISWNADQFNLTGQDLSEELATTKPRIAVHSNRGGSEMTSISISSGQMQPGNDKIVADRIHTLLTQKRSKPAEMTAPSDDLTGRWDVDIQFYSSKSQHTLFIEEQDGNWIQGSHKGDFSNRDLAGIMEGNQVKLSSTDRHVADNIPFIFSGTLAGDTITGEIYMGEYIRSQFTAKRHTKNTEKRQIRFPKGQPLAT